jgi:hypothetical protein
MKDTDDLLVGAVDMHVHAKPDFHPRIADELTILKDALNYGMKAVVSKSHYTPNADRLQIVNSLVENITCYGGIVLNPTVGGLNPYAVEAAIKYGGKVVWMPSFYSQAHLNNFPDFKGAVSGPEEGISIQEDGKLVAPIFDILKLISENNVILGTSHCSEEEIFILVKESSKFGIKKIVITHPYCPVPDLDIKKQKELTELGAFLELCLFSAMPISGKVTIKDFVNTIRTVGPEHVVLGTDFGQPYHPMPAEGMRMFTTGLLSLGISRDAIDIMVKKNPYYLLDI